MNNNSIHLHEILAIVKKIDSSQNALSEQINGLSGQMVVLTERVDKLTDRVDKLTDRVDLLEERMDRLEKKVHKMDNDNKHKEKRASDIIEVNKDTEIGNILRRSFAGVYELKYFKKFVHPNSSKEITEFDGFFIIDCSRRNLANRPRNNNCIISNSNGKTIIVEAKTTLTIQKINEKIQKIKEMYDILFTYRNKHISNTTKLFQTIYKENKLHLLPLKFYLIFAPQIIKESIIIDYINDINSGSMDKIKYNNYMFKLLKSMELQIFREDKVKKEERVVNEEFRKYIDILLKTPENLLDKGKEYFLSNLPDILNMLNNDAKIKYRTIINEMKSVLIPYDTMKESFDFFSQKYLNNEENIVNTENDRRIRIPNINNTKGRIGLYYEERLDLPELFDSEPLMRVGGFHKTRKIKS